MNVHLTPELEQFVKHKAGSGRYNSASEVVREALRLMELRELRNRIDKGLAETDRGECVDGEPFMQGLIDDLDVRETKRQAG